MVRKNSPLRGRNLELDHGGSNWALNANYKIGASQLCLTLFNFVTRKFMKRVVSYGSCRERVEGRPVPPEPDQDVKLQFLD